MDYYKIFDDAPVYRVHSNLWSYDITNSINNYLLSCSIPKSPLDNQVNTPDLDIAMEHKARSIAEFFTYLENLKIHIFDVDKQTLSDFLIHIRCPEGVKFNQINNSKKSEIQVNNYIRELKGLYSYMCYLGFYGDSFQAINHYLESVTIDTVRNELNKMNTSALNKINLVYSLTPYSSGMPNKSISLS